MQRNHMEFIKLKNETQDCICEVLRYRVSICEHRVRDKVEGERTKMKANMKIIAQLSFS